MSDLYQILLSPGDYHNAYKAVIFLASLGTFISSLEYLFIHKEFKDNGVFSWKILSSRPNYLEHKHWLQSLDFLFSYHGILILNAIRILSSVILPFTSLLPLQLVCIFFIAFISLVFSYRNIYGNDGSDQMSMIIYITLFIVLATGDQLIYKVGLIFIAAQAIASYIIAGVAKVLSVKWRTGVAIFQIMNTKTYGHKGIATFLYNRKTFNTLLCWKVFLMEMLFFCVILVPAPWFFLFLLWGILFHLYNAFAMGLNSFFWAFTATYPAIIYLNLLITH